MPSQTGSIWSMIIFYVLIFGAMYLLIFRPQRNKEKKTREMINAVQVGQNITTIGGIVGKIINIKDDVVTLETGAEKTKIRIKKWAIKEVEKLVEA